MTQYSDSAPPTTPIPVPDSTQSSTTDAAKDQASQVKDSAASAASSVTETAKDQAASVVSDAKNQAGNLLHQTRDEVTSQASTQQQRAAGGLRSLSDELHSMADRSDADGPATSLARQAADRVSTAAGWLEDREPGEVLSDVKRFARQRPGAFLAIAAGAGVLAARLARGLTADSDGASSATNAPSAAGTNAYRSPRTAAAPLAGDFGTGLPPLDEPDVAGRHEYTDPAPLPDLAVGVAAPVSPSTVINPATGGPTR